MSDSIWVNGRARSCPPQFTLAALVREFFPEADTPENLPLAVEVNGGIVNRRDLGDRIVRPGDTIELIHFVGGG